MNSRIICALACLIPAFTWATDAPLVADTYVSTANPSLNFGNLPTLTVGGGSTALIQFDLSTLPIPPSALSFRLWPNITKATLQVFVNRVGTAGSITVAPLLGGWTESAVTNATLPGIDTPGNSSAVVTTAGQYVSIDVTQQVQNWVSQSSNYGLALTSSGLMYLDSKESTTTSHLAKLDITFVGGGLLGSPGGLGGQGTDASSCTLADVKLVATGFLGAGWTAANGQLLAVQENPSLFGLLGTNFGGDGTSNFALPNLQRLTPNGLIYVICVEGNFP